MRFDEFVERHGITVFPVDQFDGLTVQVGLPQDWELHNSGLGIRVWVWRTDPHINDFCANAVLTMHRVTAPLDPGEVFTMLSDQQLQSVPGCHELHRGLTVPIEDTGATGVHVMQINHELGALGNASRSRIITTELETLIAQLTVTARNDSPVDRENIWLSVRPSGATQMSAAAGPESTGCQAGAPVTGTRAGN